MITQGDASGYAREGPPVTAHTTSLQGERAVVELTFPNGRFECALVRERGAWRVDLPLGFAPLSAP